MRPSGPRMLSAGNSSNTTTTTGGRRSTCTACDGSSPPRPAHPASRVTAASSAASQQDHRAAIGYLEHLHLVAPFAQRLLRNHDGVLLQIFTTEVEASCNGDDHAIDRNGDVTGS